MHRHTFAAVALSGLLTLAVQPVRAQETPSDTLLTVDHYLDYESALNPRISPDGSQIIYTRRYVDKLEDKWETALWLMNADGTHDRFLAKGGNAEWSPDGTRIAYLAEGEPKGPQIFVRWLDAGGASSQITRLTDAPGDIRWSPDGKSISFTMNVPTKDPWKISMPEPPKGAKWTDPPRIVGQMHFRADRRGYLDPGYTHLFVVSADGGTPRQLTHGHWNVGTRFDGLPGNVLYDWTPDGKTIIVPGLTDTARADRNYRNSALYAVTVADGAIRQLTTDSGTWTSPVVSPSGKLIAFAGHPFMPQTYKTSELWVMDVGGGGMRKISGALDRDVDDVTWAPDNSGVYFAADDHGTANVHFASVGGAERAVTTGAHMLSLGGLSKNGIGVGVRSAFQAPPDVVKIDLRRGGQVTRLTHLDDDLLARMKLASEEEFTIPSTGGAKVQGWIVKPPSFDKSKKYPLILEIHGGPAGMYGTGFSYSFQNFAANGFVVLYINPRGSTGYGTAFGNAINKAYPSVDYDDLMAAVDTVVARGYVDTRSMFVGGCSGGGVLSSWVIGHTTRFAAAAVRCPVIDWISMAGQTDVPLFTYSWFEKPFWEDPKPWLEKSSLMYVGNVKTPTMIMTGVLDMRTPMPQSEEYYEALKMRGVPAVLLRFEGEYHGTGSKPSNFMRTQLYMRSWYKKWGGTGAQTASAP